MVVNPQISTQAAAPAINHYRLSHQSLPEEGVNTTSDSIHCGRSNSIKNKERIEMYKNLKNQLKELRTELNNGVQNNAPFKANPSNYVEKILNLLRIINEIEKNTNLAELRTEVEKYKSKVEKIRIQKQSVDYELA